MMRFRLILMAVFAAIVLLVLVDQPVELPLIGNISLGLYIYGTIALIMAVLIANPKLAQRPTPVLFLPVLAFYGLWKSIFSISMVVDLAFIYVTIAEITLLYVTLYAAQIISLSVSNLETSIQNAVFQLDNVAVLSEQEGEKAIGDEIVRARRYERAVAVVHIQVPRLQKKSFDGWRKEKILEYKYVYSRVVQIISSLMHETDFIAWHKNNLVVCMPEATSDQVGGFVSQLESLLAIVLPEKSTVAVSQFPNDALVYEDLMTIGSYDQGMLEPLPMPLLSYADIQPSMADSA